MNHAGLMKSRAAISVALLFGLAACTAETRDPQSARSSDKPTLEAPAPSIQEVAEVNTGTAYVGRLDISARAVAFDFDSDSNGMSDSAGVWDLGDEAVRTVATTSFPS